MKYLKLLLIFFLILLINSCGYKKLNSEKFINFKINKLEIKGEKKLAYKLKNNIKIYSSQNSKYIYDLEINLLSTKTTKIKDSAGKTTRHSKQLQADTLVTNINTQKKFKKVFRISNDYDVATNHSVTLNNEKKADENNLDYTSNEVIKYLKLLNIQ